jgi:DNA repair photolyase
MGLSAGLDFETIIFVKERAPELLRDELNSRTWKPQVLAMSGATDAYQPIERRLQLTRACLEVLADFRSPVGIVTKNHLVCRDIDVLQELAKYQAAAVAISVTTLDPDLARKMEPRASHPDKRIEAIRRLTDAGIPTSVMVGPVIPGLTDHELPEIIGRAVDAGASRAGYIMLRLPYGVKDLFRTWLEQHYPNRADKVLSWIQEVRGGRMNDTEFGKRMRGAGPIAELVRTMYKTSCRRHGIGGGTPPLSTEAFRRVDARQPTLF